MNSPTEHDPSGAADGASGTAAPAVAGVLIVLTNVPDDEIAQEIAEALVGERLAACVNILAACASIYRWQGEVESADEVPLLIKTTTDRYEALRHRLEELHPYDVPEIIAWRSAEVSAAYLQWAISETRPQMR